MTDIDALTLRQELTRVLDEASAGEVFTITKRGKPIARLGPISDARPITSQPARRVDTRDAEPRVVPPTKPDPDRVRATVRPIGLSKKDQAGGRYDR